MSPADGGLQDGGLQATDDLGAADGLYVHVPFCSAICPYCDFAVVKDRPEQHASYAQALRHELDSLTASPWSFDSIYFGGGTPSALSGSELQQILESLRRTFVVASNVHLTLEVNPEDVLPDNLQAWRDLGVTRLSLGVQSFDDVDLKFLGRRHDAEQARTSVAQVLEAGFEEVSIDLIFGLPSQSVPSWRRQLELAASLDAPHISCYQLTIHEGTPFYRKQAQGRLAELSNTAQAEHFFATHSTLEQAGYVAYEVSNFARAPRFRSYHNQKYWNHTPYLGVGPSAHSFRDGERWWNLRELSEYRARLERGESPVAERESLDSSQLALEAVMLGLRTTAGIDLVRLRSRYGVDLVAQNEVQLAEWAQAGLAQVNSRELRLTLDGLAQADGLAAKLVL